MTGSLVCKAGIPEGYEGNAQSFRIITELAVSDESDEWTGLDLTRATLNATLKYPWVRQPAGRKHKKWGYYSSENEEFDFARAGMVGDQPCLEAQIMTWADDIAYAIHDTEDFYQAGFIPLHTLWTNADEGARFLNAACSRLGVGRPGAKYAKEDLEEAFDGFFALMPMGEPYRGTHSDRARVRAYTSAQIGRFLTPIRLRAEPDENGELLEVPTIYRTQIDLVKQLTWHYVIDNPSLAAQQHGQRNVIKTLFQSYYRAVLNREWRMLPPAYQDRVRQEAERDSDRAKRSIVRIVADMIAEMTDHQAWRMYQRITGQLPGSVLDPIFG